MFYHWNLQEIRKEAKKKNKLPTFTVVVSYYYCWRRAASGIYCLRVGGIWLMMTFFFRNTANCQFAYYLKPTEVRHSVLEKVPVRFEIGWRVLAPFFSNKLLLPPPPPFFAGSRINRSFLPQTTPSHQRTMMKMWNPSSASLIRDTMSFVWAWLYVSNR